MSGKASIDAGPEWHIELSGEANFGICDCCGRTTRRVWGWLHSEASSVLYFVQWAPEAISSHGAAFDMVVGLWGDGTSPADRSAVASDLRWIDGAPQFLVVDAEGRTAGSKTIAARALSRADVIGTPLAQQFFALIDQVWLRDDRIAELLDTK